MNPPEIPELYDRHCVPIDVKYAVHVSISRISAGSYQLESYA
jgi:hypothetical protein